MITVDMTLSPSGKSCVVMKTEDGKEWLLLAVKRGIAAGALMKQLKSDFSTEALLGPPIDEDMSRREGRLSFSPYEGVIGVYVQSDRFDELMSLFFFG